MSWLKKIFRRSKKSVDPNQFLYDRVAKGVAFLDEHGPDAWWDRIDLHRLDMDNPTRCVLAQLSHPYDYRQSYALGLNTFGISNNTSVKYGFNLDYKVGNYLIVNWFETEGQMNILTQEWKRVIKAKRGED